MTKKPTKSNKRYCTAGLPKRKLKPGFYLVHNRIEPGPLGLNGFRAWVQKGRTDPPLAQCHCDFGGNRNAANNKHYRLRRGLSWSALIARARRSRARDES
jgi:hypothetical protein